MTQPTFAQLRSLMASGPGYSQESLDERLLTLFSMLASGQNPDGSAFSVATSGGGTPNATTLLGVVNGTDGATVTTAGTWASFSTAFSKQVTTTALADVLIDVVITLAAGSGNAWALRLTRGGVGIATSALIPDVIGANDTATVAWSFTDTALAAGTYTYEIQVAATASQTMTLKNAVAAAFSLTSTGASQMRISQGANV